MPRRGVPCASGDSEKARTFAFTDAGTTPVLWMPPFAAGEPLHVLARWKRDFGR